MRVGSWKLQIEASEHRPDLSDAVTDTDSARRLDRLVSGRNLAISAFLFGALVVLFYRPFSHPEVGDKAIYDYIAQSIVRGQVPYRDAIDPKAPGSMYLGALAILAGKAVGVRDVYSIRWLNILMVGALALVTYLTAEAYLRSGPAAVLAFLIPLMTTSYLLFMVGGTQPKLPLMVFGLLSLLLIAKDQPFWSGFCSMLACLCWQPGLMFTGVAVLMFSRYLTSWRDLRALKVVLGALPPVSSVLAYFYWKGALGDLWSWTITYTYSVFGPEEERAFSQALSHFWGILRREFGTDVYIVGLSVVGLAIYAGSRLRERLKRDGLRSDELFRDALVFPPLIYLTFCMINFQGGPDLIPLFPFVGLFAGWLIVETARWASRLELLSRITVSNRLSALIVGVAVASVATLTLLRAARYETDRWTLQEQEVAVREIAAHLGPGDKMYVHAAAEVLLLLNRPNVSRYIAFDAGADDYLAAGRLGGFQDVIGEIEAEKPRVVVMARLRNVNRREELEQWVAEHYEPLEIHGYRSVYIRREE